MANSFRAACIQLQVGKDTGANLAKCLAAVGTALVAYFIAEVALGAKPHPIHWAALVGGGLLGIPLGWLWYRWRGDII